MHDSNNKEAPQIGYLSIIALACGIVSWFLLIIYLTRPHPNLHLEAIFGSYKTSVKIGETSFVLASIGTLTSFVQLVILRNYTPTVLLGTVLSLSALLMSMYGVPL